MPSNLSGDLRQAFRMFVKHRGLSAIAVLSLAVGVGATSTAFSLIESIRLRALPYPEPDRLVALGEGSSRRAPEELITTARYSTYRLWDESLRTVRPLGAHVISGGYVVVDGESGQEPLALEAVSSNLFEILGTKPRLGRSFAPGDEAPGAPPVALVSDRLWRSRLRASPDALGRVLRISGNAFSVVGVLPPEVRFEYGTDVWVPLAPHLRAVAASEGRADLANASVRLVGRLSNGARLEEARAELALASPPPPAGQPPWVSFVRPFRRDALRYWRSYDLAFGAIALAVLLVGCANLAGLLVVRTIARRRELAVRSALGATPRRLARQLFAEGLLLAGAGGGAGALAARWGTALVSPLRSAMGILPDALASRLGSASVAVSVLVAVAAALLVSLAPVVWLARAAPQKFLRGSAVGQIGQRSRRRAQHVFVAIQIAGAVILVSLGGAAARSYRDFGARDDGDDASRIVYLQTQLPNRGAVSPAAAYAPVHQRLLAVPGVEAAGAQFREFAGRDRIAGGSAVLTVLRAHGAVETSGARLSSFAVNGDFFAAIGAAMRRGRSFGPADDVPGANVAIVNELAARRWWPGEDPIGKRLKFGRTGDRSPWATVVGVVEDSRETDPIAIVEDLRPTVFVPLARGLGSAVEVFLRLRGPSSPEFLDSIRRTVHEISPDGSAIVTTQKALYREVLDPMRRNVVGVFVAAACGLLLAAIGVYGVLAHAVSRRTQEIGVRMALGAGTASVTRLVLREGAGLAAAGLAAGLAAAAAALRLLQGLFFGGLRLDGATLFGVAAVLGALTFLAAALPLRRALRVDPMTALRSE